MFRRIAAVNVCMWSSNFGKRTRQFICYFHDVQDSHNPHSYHCHSLFRYLKNHLLINLVTPHVIAPKSGTANINLPRNSQCESKLIVFLQPERYKNKVRTNRVTYWMFSGAKIPGPTMTYPLEFTWVSAKISKKQLVRKSSCPTEN